MSDRIAELEARIQLLEGMVDAQQLLIDEQAKQIQALREERDFLLLENQWLREQIRRDKFEPRSERQAVIDSNQVALPWQPIANDFAPKVANEPEEKPPRKRAKRSASLETDPTRVQEIRTKVYPEQRICRCCEHPLVELGWDESITLERIPSMLRKHVTERVKLGCNHCKEGGIHQAKAATRSIDGVLVDNSLLADIVLMNLDYHLPLHRLERLFASEGLRISRETLGRYVHAVGLMLKPIVAYIEQQLKQSPWIAMDSSWLPMQQKKICHRAAVWVAHGSGHRVVFRYTQTGTQEEATRPWNNYCGVVLCDAAAVFEPLFVGQVNTQAIRAHCNAHARRMFIDAQKSDPERATMALFFYQRLYHLEKQLKGCSAEQRSRQRKWQSEPILKSFHTWLNEQAERVAARSPMDKAIRYTLRHWKGLIAFVNHGEIEIDNNTSERELRHLVVGRKNWLFKARKDHAETMCVLYSLLSMCRRLQIHSRDYLLWALKQIHVEAAIERLTPQFYARSVNVSIASVG